MADIMYQNGKIYRLICEDGHYYIGSTVNQLNYRFNNHKVSSKHKSSKVYNYINKIGWDKVKIELVEKFPCKNKEELNKKEDEYISKLKDDKLCLNETKPIIREKQQKKDDANVYYEESTEEQDDTLEDPRYTNGKIYRLLCEDGYYYIGSTINNLNYRLSNHKGSSKRETSKVYNHINKIGWDNVTIELLEEYPCKNRQELNEKETQYICELKEDELCLNINRSYVTPEQRKEDVKEYYEENKERIIEQHREYLADPKVKVQADTYQANYRKENAEKRRAYSKKYAEEHPEAVKEARKEYYEENKERVLQQQKEYTEKNKERIQEKKREWQQRKKAENAPIVQAEREKRKQIRAKKSEEQKLLRETPVKCECGGSYQPYRKSRHEEGKKHTAFMKKM